MLNAAVETLGMNFLSLYAIKLGWSESATSVAWGIGPLLGGYAVFPTWPALANRYCIDQSAPTVQKL